MEKSFSTEEIENILTEYKPLVLKIAMGYYIQGGEMDDLIQEGMISLYLSIFTYQKERSSFSTYAYMCISSRLKNVVKKDRTYKTKILSEAVLLENDAVSNCSVEDEYIIKEEMKSFRIMLFELLSPLEFQVVELFLSGLSYEEISKISGIVPKSVDNALSRAKKKISQSAR